MSNSHADELRKARAAFVEDRRGAEAKNPDIYAAFDAALEKVATQLRRTKRAFRDQKGERADKDIALREDMRLTRVDDEGTSQS